MKQTDENNGLGLNDTNRHLLLGPAPCVFDRLQTQVEGTKGRAGAWVTESVPNATSAIRRSRNFFSAINRSLSLNLGTSAHGLSGQIAGTRRRSALKMIGATCRPIIADDYERLAKGAEEAELAASPDAIFRVARRLTF